MPQSLRNIQGQTSCNYYFIAFPSTAYCDIPSPDTAYCITGYGILLSDTAYCISAYGILHHRIRHIAL